MKRTYEIPTLISADVVSKTLAAPIPHVLEASFKNRSVGAVGFNL